MDLVCNTLSDRSVVFSMAVSGIVALVVHRSLSSITFLVLSHQRDLRERRLHRRGLDSCHFHPRWMSDETRRWNCSIWTADGAQITDGDLECKNINVCFAVGFSSSWTSRASDIHKYRHFSSVPILSSLELSGVDVFAAFKLYFRFYSFWISS